MARISHYFGYLIAFAVTQAVVFPVGAVLGGYFLFRAGAWEYRDDHALAFNEALYGNTLDAVGFWVLVFAGSSIVSLYLLRTHWWENFGSLGKLEEVKRATYAPRTDDHEAPLVTSGYFLPEEEPRWEWPAGMEQIVHAGAALIAFAVTYVLVFIFGIFFGFLLFGGVPLADILEEYAGVCLVVATGLFAWRNFRRQR